MEIELKKVFTIKKEKKYTQAFIGRWEFVFYGTDQLDVLFGHSVATRLSTKDKKDVIITSKGGEQIMIRMLGDNKYCIQ